MTDDTERLSALATPVTVPRNGEVAAGVFALDGTPLSRSLHVRTAIDHGQVPGVNRDLLLQAPTISEPHTYGGILFNHFGHFLVESIGRLWAADAEEGTDRKILFLPQWGRPNLADESHFVAYTLRLFDIDPKRVLLLHSPARFENLIVPTDLWGFPRIRTGKSDPRMRALFARSGRNLSANDHSKPQPRRRLYVSRSKLDELLGGYAGEDAFERYMRVEGYEIMYPEKLRFSEQLALYRSAERIVFAEGSAIYACMLLPDLTANIAVISRRSNANSWTSGLFRQLKLDALIIDCVRKQVTFGLADYYGISIVDWFAISKQLLNAGFVRTLFEEWPQLASKSIRTRYNIYLERVRNDAHFVPPKPEELDALILTASSDFVLRRKVELD